jgi:hypothetical protein
MQSRFLCVAGFLIVGALLAPRIARAQTTQVDSAFFAVLKGADTIAVETFAREGHELRGQLVKVAAGRERTIYRAALMDDASTPLVEFSVWKGEDLPNSPARQQGRVIFKEDSAAVDEADSRGLRTIMFKTERGAITYLNLSFALLEQATRRAKTLKQDSVSVPFFNLGGGQTLDGKVLRLTDDSAAVRLGSVEFRLQIDPAGRIMGGAIPSQSLVVSRSP